MHEIHICLDIPLSSYSRTNFYRIYPYPFLFTYPKPTISAPATSNCSCSIMYAVVSRAPPKNTSSNVSTSSSLPSYFHKNSIVSILLFVISSPIYLPESSSFCTSLLRFLCSSSSILEMVSNSASKARNSNGICIESARISCS